MYAKLKSNIYAACKALAFVCLGMLSGLVALVLLFMGILGKVSYDAHRFTDELKHTVSADPDGLRTWVLAQFKKYPQGGDIPENVDGWPEKLNRRYTVYLAPPNEGMLLASLSWSSSFHTSMITIRINPDGTPADVRDEADLPPDRLWAKGISFTNIPR